MKRTQRREKGKSGGAGNPTRITGILPVQDQKESNGRSVKSGTKPHGQDARDTAHQPALVLVRTVAGRQVVMAMCLQARQRGVRVGFSLAQARALCPGLVYADEDPGRDARGLEALGRWMMRFTPWVQVGSDMEDQKHGRDARATSASGLFLDVTGTERLFGSLEVLLEKIAGALKAMGISARVAIGPNIGAAWALTYVDPPGRAIVTENGVASLALLPVMALRLDDKILATLHHLGLETIGQVLKLPRASLPARFGPALLQRIDQALGKVAEPMTPLPFQAPIEAAVDFDGVVDSLEAIWLAFKDLIGQVTVHLVRRGLGVRQMVVTFLRPYAPAIEKRIELSRPSRQGAILFNLIRCAMETIGERRHGGTEARRHEGGKRQMRFMVKGALKLDESEFVPRGFTGLKLVVARFERLTDEQIFLLEQEEEAGREELDRLVERLRIRLGEEACVAVRGVECYVPERGWGEGEEARRHEGTKARREYKESMLALSSSTSCLRAYVPSCLPLPSRPLHLLPMPCEVRVMVRPSHDRDGAPVSFVLEGQVHRIAHAVGPERICGMWWIGHDKTRDYFDVEDEEGKRWWLFRVVQSSKWYLHGRFE